MPSPLPLTTKIAPSGANPAAVGYQPVGMKPRETEAPGRDTSNTASVLLSALATSSVLPSALSASPFGVDPAGMFGNIAVSRRSVTRSFLVSITSTRLVFAHATKRREPSFESTMWFGCGSVESTRIWPSRRRTSATALPPQRET